MELKDELNSIYKRMFHGLLKSGRNMDSRSGLTANEQHSMDTITDLSDGKNGGPTVAQFKDKEGISAPNAAYRVKKLIDKKFLEKVQDKKDNRRFHLHPTQKYMNYVRGRDNDYFERLSDKIRQSFKKEDYDKLTEMLISVDELMKEMEQGGNPDGTDEGKAE